MKKHKEHNSFPKTLVKSLFNEIHQARLKGLRYWQITLDVLNDAISDRSLRLHYRVECAVRGVEAVLYVR